MAAGSSGGSPRADDWYRSADWDDAAQGEFARRLARARAGNRVQYRRIKAIALIRSGDPARQAAGAGLLEEHLADATVYAYERTLAHVLLADLARSRGDLAAAEAHVREALRISGPDGSGTSGEEEILLAEILLERGGRERVEEAQALLDRRADDRPSLFVRSRHRLYVAQTRASLALGDRKKATEWARAALDAASAQPSGLRYHPTLGLVPDDPELRRWLDGVASGRV